MKKGTDPNGTPQKPLKSSQRAILALLAAFLLTSCNAVEPESRKLPELQPKQPIYQKSWGWGKPTVIPFGGLRQVRERDPVTIEEMRAKLKRQDMEHEQEMKEQARENKLREHRIGSWLKVAGWAMIGIGFVLHGLTASGVVKSIGSSVITLGAVGIIGGLCVQKTVEHETIITLAVGLAFAVWLLYNWRNKSVLRWGKDKVIDRFMSGFSPENP